MPPLPTEQDISSAPSSTESSSASPPERSDAAQLPVDELRLVRNELMSEFHHLRTDLVRTTASLKKALIATGISVAVVIVLGVAAFNTVLFSGLNGVFESGRTSGKSMEVLGDEMAQVRAALKDLNGRLDSQAAAAKPAEKARNADVVKPVTEKAPALEAGASVAQDCSNLPPDIKTETMGFSIQFQAGRAAISPASEEALASIHKLLALSPDRCVIVEGHTDATGKTDKNMLLSKDRAVSVVNQLVEKGGIDRKRLVPVGKGSTSPLIGNDPNDSRNRRIVFRIVTG